MKGPFHPGAHVRWRMGSRWESGRIVESHPWRATQSCNVPEAPKSLSVEQLAYLIDQDEGGCVLKSHTEVEPVDERQTV